MGILSRPAAIVEALSLPAGFTVAELGNQIYRANGRVHDAFHWYAGMGCANYTSIDANGKATVMADLNRPLNLDEMGLYDLVTDFGSGEHIFNQAQVWETLHDLCKVGGLIIFDRPKTGWTGHCFYNIHETLARDLAEANNYRIVHLETHTIEGHGELLFGILQKVSGAPFRYPQQGKYRARLEAAAAPVKPKRVKRGDVLLDLVKRYGWTKGAEIGVYNGEQCFFKLLDKCPHVSLIAVDNWSATDPDYGDLTEVGRAFVKKAEVYGDRARVLLGKSAEMAAHVEDGSLDWVFIDAAHDYESVKADVVAWAPKVRKYGFIMGHDIDFPSVKQAVEEAFRGTRTLCEFEDDVWAVPA
jgi:predicted O-methyltransferase YrrM